MAYSCDDGTVKVLSGSGNRDVVPSMVLFTGRALYVGDRAKDLSSEHDPSLFISGFKRQMGTDYVRTVQGQTYTPTEISAIVVKKLLMDFESLHKAKIRQAVITVPGEYGDAERNATIEAGRIAGLETVELLNESVAAALSYGIGMDSMENKTIIVYDLGGGTFDATVMKISNGRSITLSNEGNKNLGGRDWDLQLASIIQRKILDSVGLRADDIEEDGDLRRNIMVEAERQKELLTYQERAISSIRVKGEMVNYTVTREEFEESTSWLMARTIEFVGSAIRDAHLDMGSVDEIILVGGATLMPQVMRALEDAFPSVEIQFFDPEHAVARGAAIYARSVFGDKDMDVVSVLGKSFGIVAGIDGKERICNILYRNVALPMERILMCRPKRDDQKKLTLMIYESNARSGEEYIDVDKGRLVSKFDIELPDRISRGRTKIAIKFAADGAGKLDILVDCNGTVIECDLARDILLSSKERAESMQKIRGII